MAIFEGENSSPCVLLCQRSAWATSSRAPSDNFFVRRKSASVVTWIRRAWPRYIRWAVPKFPSLRAVEDAFEYHHFSTLKTFSHFCVEMLLF